MNKITIIAKKENQMDMLELKNAKHNKKFLTGDSYTEKKISKVKIKSFESS